MNDLEIERWRLDVMVWERVKFLAIGAFLSATLFLGQAVWHSSVDRTPKPMRPGDKLVHKVFGWRGVLLTSDGECGYVQWKDDNGNVLENKQSHLLQWERD